MLFNPDALLFYVIASLGLAVLAFGRERGSPVSMSERYGWLSLLFGLLHPASAWIADHLAIHGDLTPFLAFDLITACALAGAAANRSPGGKAFLPLITVGAVALSIAVQQVPVNGIGITGSMLTAVVLSAVFIGAAAECARYARLECLPARPLFVLALLSSLAAVLQLTVLLLHTTPPNAALSTQLGLEAAGMSWLIVKLLITGTLLRLFVARRTESLDRLSRRLVEQANLASSDLRVISQAFYQMPGKVLVTNASGRILFANADARRMLDFPARSEWTLEDCFIAVQPTGHQQVRALFERPDHQAALVHIRMTPVACREQDYHLLQLEMLPFDFLVLRHLLVDSCNDAPHEASGLLDHNFAITAMADGWFRLFDPVDRYASSGLLWDKLRLISASDSEISYLESAIASAHQAQAWLTRRDGSGLSVTLHKLHTPERKLFYRIYLSLVDDPHQVAAAAPYKNQGARSRA